MSKDIRAKIGIAFKRDGLVIQGQSAFDYIMEQLRLHHEDREFLVKLLKSIDRRSLHQNFVDLGAAQRAVSLITLDVESTVEEESLKVLSAFEFPRLVYHSNRKTFTPDLKEHALHGSADDLACMFRNRFELLFQRLQRHHMFSSNCKLATVKSLLGVTGQRVVFGMLTRNSRGDLVLEDLNNTMPIDVENAKMEDGIYTDHCMVLADGELKQGKFVVDVLAMPPLEEARTTLSTFSNVDMFGGAHNMLREEIAIYQQNCEEAMFVVLSDVFLDSPNVMQKLEVLFDGYKDIVPTAFIFTGNYTSRPFGKTPEDVARLQAAFQGLTRLIFKNKSLVMRSKWIFSRGPSDAGGPLVFPQFALPDFFVASLKKLPDVVFTTNPFRLRWCNVKMVFFRENLISKMGRHSLFPKLLVTRSPAELLVKTLMEQAHLCPLPQSVCPLYWNFDHAMYLYPIPDLLVACDSFAQYTVKEEEYFACNPGPFSRDFTFTVIRPATLEVEESRIPDVSEAMDDDGGEEAQQLDKAVEEENEEEEPGKGLESDGTVRFYDVEGDIVMQDAEDEVMDEEEFVEKTQIELSEEDEP